MRVGGVSGTRRRFDCRDGSGCSCGRCGGCSQCTLPRLNSDDGVNRTQCLRLSVLALVLSLDVHGCAGGELNDIKHAWGLLSEYYLTTFKVK